MPTLTEPWPPSLGAWLMPQEEHSWVRRRTLAADGLGVLGSYGRGLGDCAALLRQGHVGGSAAAQGGGGEQHGHRLIDATRMCCTTGVTDSCCWLWTKVGGEEVVCAP